MSTDATLTSKGQTTIPKSIRDSLGMKPGDRMTFTLMPDGVVIMRVKNKRVSELAGLLHKRDALVLRRPAKAARAGWAAAAQKITESGDDELVLGEFNNEGDVELVW